MRKIIIILMNIIAVLSCSSPEKSRPPDSSDLSYAKGFEIRDYTTYREIIVKNPWQKSQGEKFSYILTSNPALIPDSLSDHMIIKTPVNQVVVFSTTHVGFIGALGRGSSVTGVSGKDFISDTTVRTSIENGKCTDVGFAPNIDYERILQMHPDIVFLYGLDPSVTGLVNRLRDSGIQSVMVSEFLEAHPLGKAEWIRFFSAFYDCESLGDSIFKSVLGNYTMLRDSIKKCSGKPSVLVGLPWKDTWYMSGGRSFTSRFIEDAGANYLWTENNSSDYIPLDLESVFQKAATADVWINTGSAETKSDIILIDPRLQYIPAFQNGNIYNNNLRMNSSGGNDFWESGAVRPDLILRDLICIFHPGKSDDNEFYFYKKLK
jgi:iron complex transport system substrate-binding protein